MIVHFRNDQNKRRDTEFFQYGHFGSGHFVLGPDIPNDAFSFGAYACAAPFDSETTFFASDVGYLYNHRTGRFSRTGGMPFRADNGICGAATGVTGERMAVIAGGMVGDNRTAIYDGHEWFEGPELPFVYFWAGRVIHTDTSFLIVGGYEYYGEEVQDSIFEFDPIGLRWIRREERLETPRGQHMAVAVDRERFCTPP